MMLHLLASFAFLVAGCFGKTVDKRGGISDSPDCKYFNPRANTNNTAYIVGPNVCLFQKDHGVVSASEYKCKSDDEVVLYFYGNVTNCNGNPTREISYKKSDGYGMNCGSKAKDCSSVLRSYQNCDIAKADYGEVSAVTGICETFDSGTSQKFSCTSTTETLTSYLASDTCDNTGLPSTYTQGCNNKTGIYYLVRTCHNAK